jgi:hypothetical protein
MTSFEAALSTHFPEALSQAKFITRSYEALQPYAFRAKNAIAFVSVCRDELTLPLVEDIERTWGEAFLFSSLAGMVFLGKTGFQAAQQHAPNEDGVERSVYFALPHIALDAEGAVGVYHRPGREKPSHACGALLSFQRELASRSLRLGLDPDDLEQSLLKQHLFRKLKYGDIPDLITLTKIAHEVILEELERMIHLTIDPVRSHYAVFTGIQIHGPEGRNFIWPGATYAVRHGERTLLPLT